MAGGEGTRLRPLTSNSPKPMLPLVNRPMMEHIIDLLVRHGIDDIVVTVAFMANNIRNYFGDGSEFGVKISYASEETPLGPAGADRLTVNVKLVVPLLPSAAVTSLMLSDGRSSLRIVPVALFGAPTT